jgi:hypothetical protein
MLAVIDWFIGVMELGCTKERASDRCFKTSLGVLSASLILTGSFCSPDWAWAASNLNLAKPEIITAIEKAKILAPGISVNADVYKEQVSVSTYRNAKANDDDCKIEAAMIGKTVLDLAPHDISRVTVYFFSMANPSQYKEVAVTAGDVKAFGAGETNEKQLISSLKLVEPQMSSIDRQLLEQYAKSSLAREPVIVKTQDKDVLEVQSELPGNLAPVDYQMEAMRIADRALLQSDVSSIKQIKLLLRDTTKEGEVRTIVFGADALEQLTADIGKLFSGADILQARKQAPSIVQNFPAEENIEVDKLDTVPGDLLDERKDLLERIRAFNKIGVGVVPFARLYLKIESEVGNVKTEQLEADVKQLADALDEQDKNYTTLKDFHPVKKDQKVAAAPSHEMVLPPSLADAGDPKQLEAKILKDPNGLIAYFEQRLTRKNHPGELHPNFPVILEFFAVTLRKNNRPQEAAKFEQRIQTIKAKKATQPKTADQANQASGQLKSGEPLAPPSDATTQAGKTENRESE